MVVEKDSAVLGYPGERSKALDANHNTVCKYDSPQDHSYQTVRDYLKTQLERLFRNRGSRMSTDSASMTDIIQLEEFFAISEAADMDYAFFGDRWTPGTCGWILEREAFREWRDDPDPTSRLLWLHGVAGTGKSVMASFLVNHLISEAGKQCQYVFLRFGDLNKKSVSKLLRSLALQSAQALPEFRQALRKISTKANLSGSHPRTIWERVFKAVLFKLRFSEPLYWVVDGLEECEAPRATIRLLSEALYAPVPIRIILTSRPASGIESELKRLPSRAKYRNLAIQGHDRDHATFIEQQLEHPDPSGELARRLVKAAQGNFLWMKLTVDRINKSYTDAAIEEALRELHPGMEELYNRMAESVEERSLSSTIDKALSTDILSWVTCSMRLLSISELSEALGTGTDQTLTLNLHKAIAELGGGFVIIDNDERVSLIHQTAREYLLRHRDKFFVEKAAANQRLLLRCLVCLNTPGLRKRITEDRAPILLEYAASYWNAHFVNSNTTSNVVISALGDFLRSSSVLTWIHAVAKKRQLEVLLQSSSQLSNFVDEWRTEQAIIQSSALEAINADKVILTEDIRLMEDWAIELVKLVGKFGSQLLHTPDSIYKMIPPFCPTRSVLHRQFVRKNSFDLFVSGFGDDWDDSLARLSFGADFEGSALIAEGDWIGVSASEISSNTSTVFLFSAATFQQLRRISLEEKLRKTKFNSLGTLMVTIGLSTTKVWDLQTGKCINIASNPRGRPRPQTVTFTQEDEVLLVGTDDRRVWSMSLLGRETTFEEVTRVTETAATGGAASSPGSMAFSPDGRLLALGYRQRPLSVWDIESNELLRCCTDLNRATAMVWHPYDGTIFGLTTQTGSRIFKWSAADDRELLSFYVEAITISISADGRILALGDQYGTVSLLSTTDLSVLHKLVSQDPVFGLAFSADGSRLYDIRSGYGNVWEPNILLKLSRPSLQISDGESEAETASSIKMELQRGTPTEAPSIKIDPITALSSQTSRGLYCTGTRQGVVTLHNTMHGEVRRLTDSRNYFSIEHISWSHDQRFLCYADVSRTIFVEHIVQDEVSESVTAGRVMELPMSILKDNVENMLFHPNSDLLLVCSRTLVAVVSIKEQRVIASRRVLSGQSVGRWILDPGYEGRLLAFTSSSVEGFSWVSLEKLYSIPLDISSHHYVEVHSRARQPAAPGTHTHDVNNTHDIANDKMEIDEVILSSSRRHALIRLSTEDHRNFVRWLDISHLYQLEAGGDISPIPLPMDVALPRDLINQLDRPLRFLGGLNSTEFTDTLLFLDCNSWVCTFQVQASRLNASFLSAAAESRAQKRPEDYRIAVRFAQEMSLENHLHSQHQQASSQTIESTVEGASMRHYCLPGDWVSPDSIGLIRTSYDGTLLCPRNGDVAVIRFPGFI